MSTEAATPELGQLLGELDVLNRKLADAHKMASLGRLSAGIVHEINSPIASIFSNCEVIQRSVEKLRSMLTNATEQANAVPAKAFVVLDSIAALNEVDRIACERISGIIRSLKTFARVNESDLVRVNINDLVSDTIKLTRTVYRRSIAFECDFAHLPEVECYPGLVNQVFLNLIVNAAQAISGEGTVTARTRLESPFVHIAISDTGAGIPDEVRPKIFTAGFTTKPLGEGTGLGLTISREIVEDTHGGRINFETETGKGTTFHVRLPIEQRRLKENRS